MRYFPYTLFPLLLLSLVAVGQTNPSNENYVLQTQYQVPVTTDLPNTAINNDKKIESIVYYDGLGRPKQSVAIRAGGNREDLVTPILYDPLGRQPKEFLPLPLTQNNGVFNSNTTVGGEPGVTKNLEDYYQTKFPNDLPQGFIPGVILNPYSEKRFENSPLNRVLEQAAPGEDWRLLPTLDVDHTIKLDYQTNAAEDYVIRFNVSFTNGDPSQPNLEGQQGYYPPNHLYKTVTKDENWEPGQTNMNNHTTEEFRDKLGRVVLKRTFDNGWLDTYYVYDDFGNLTYVIPPLVDKNNNDVSPDELNELCYQYKYDYRNRLIWKKIPGKGYETILYNDLNRPVLTQDANMREDDPNKYLFTKYDGLGRVAYTGFYTAAIPKQSIEDSLQNRAPASISEVQKTIAEGPVQIGDTQVYYTNSSFPYYNLQVLTINYYDKYVDYTVPGNNGLLLPTYIYDQKTTEHTLVGTTTQGLPTVSKVRVLGQTSAKWITSLTAYDSRGRAIYSDSYNEYLASRDILHSNLDLITGRPIETFTVHKKGTAEAINIFDYFTYDHMGRLRTQEQQIDGSPAQLIAKNTYDELGQLVRKDVGGETAVDGYTDIEEITATFDGMLNHTSIEYNWPSKLKTKGRIVGDGGITFKVEGTNNHVRVGLLKPTNDGADNIYLDYGFYLRYVNNAYKVYIIVNGADQSTLETYAPNDTFKVERVGTQVKFYHNSAAAFATVNYAGNNEALTGKVSFSGPGGSISHLGLYGPKIDKILQNVDYRYNIRGWLTDINYVGTYTEGLIGLDNDLFNFRINYNRVEGNATNAPLYNGNIAQTLWKTKSTDKNVRGYSYSYDPLNRIKGAESYKGANLNTMALNSEYTVGNIGYDQNGNIITLARWGADDNTVPVFGQWDNLGYSYNGNQLMKVVDNAAAAQKNFGFRDGANTGDDYDYDSNGNMKLDKNKGITSITYNHLNLPTEIIFSSIQNKKIEYVYDAIGTKMSKNVTDWSSVLTEYAGGFIYNNAGSAQMLLQFFSQPEGYVKPVAGTSESVEGFDKDIGGTTNSTYSYVFQYKDHLGNVRLSYSDNDLNGSINPATEIVEESNYYPFGLQQKGYNNNVSPNGNALAQKYKTYQGQEISEELGYNMLEFKYRHYDAAIGRFVAIDPLAMKYVYNSTYAFQENKLGLGVELEGLELSSQRSDDGKSVTLTQRVKPVNNSNILTGDQFNTLVSARISQTQKALSGDAGNGVTVTANVVIDENATLIMEYNDALSTGDSVGEAMGLGHTDDNGNTQSNTTQVNVPFAFEFDENGQIEFTEEGIQDITNTGTHEDGHQAGLSHVPDENNSTNAMQETNSGSTLTPEQRAQVIKTVEQEQPKQQ